MRGMVEGAERVKGRRRRRRIVDERRRWLDMVVGR